MPPHRISAAEACARYEAVRGRLPSARFPDRPETAPDLAALADRFDAFVLDGFGVLNIGAAPVPGAPERVAELRALGKSVIVLTNSATRDAAATVEKYAGLGIAFAPQDVVSSRDALTRALDARPPRLWGFAATPASKIERLAPGALRLGDDPADYARAEGFALLSADEWGHARHALMAQALKARPRPVLVGNPDLVAPREDGLSLEPGFYAHALQDEAGVAPEFHGKPFADAFALAAARLPAGLDPRRVAMVGDTLHTDILGGAAQGWRTVLVRAHGLMRDLDHLRLIAESGIVPDFIVETT